MKISVIRDIRYGKIKEESEKAPEGLWKNNKSGKIAEKFLKTLDEKQRELFFEYQEEAGNAFSEECDAYFQRGFRYGLLLGIEIFTEDHE